MKLTSITIIIILIILSVNTYAAEYYVKNNGNDNLNGLTDATAWATIEKVQNTVNNGDVVYFRSQDTWTGSGDYILRATTGVTYDGSTYGTGKRATFQAAGDMDVAMVAIYEGNVIFKGFEIDGNNKITGGIYAGMHAGESISDITIDNCEVHNTYIPEGNWAYGIHACVTLGDRVISNVIIKNSIVHDTGHEGISLYCGWGMNGNFLDGVIVRNNTVYNTGKDGASWGDGIHVTNGVRNALIEYNDISTSTSRGFGIGTSESGAINTPDNITFRYNTVHDNAYVGAITSGRMSGLDGTFNIVNNIFYNNGKPESTHAYELYIGRGEYGNSVLNINNNVFYSLGNSAQYPHTVMVCEWSTDLITGTPTINFNNNILVGGDWTPLKDIRNYISSHSNNIIYRSSGINDEHVNNGVSYDGTNIINWEPTAIVSDPLFVDPSGPFGPDGIMWTSDDGFRLQSGSPAIGAGVEGNDIGAYENNGDSSKLYFKSGFEANTIATLVSEQYHYWKIDGTDTVTGYDWTDDIEEIPYMRGYLRGGLFGNHENTWESDCFAEITTDPDNSMNSVMHFRQYGAPTGSGRVSAALMYNYEDSEKEIFEQGYIKYRMRLSEGIGELENIERVVDWFMFTELWEKNQEGISHASWWLNIYKDAGVGQPLHWGMGMREKDESSFRIIWKEKNREVPVPIEEWFTFEMFYKKGDENNGRIWVAITPDGGEQQVLFDIHDYTEHTSNPHIIGDWTVFKLYIDPELVEFMKNLGKSLGVYYDDFEYWDSIPGSSISTCSSGADSSGDSIISKTELNNFISSWKTGSITITELINGINEWKIGC